MQITKQYLVAVRLSIAILLFLIVACKSQRNIQRISSNEDSTKISYAQIKHSRAIDSLGWLHHIINTQNFELKNRTIVTVIEETPLFDSNNVANGVYKKTTIIDNDRGSINTSTNDSRFDSSKLKKVDEGSADYGSISAVSRKIDSKNVDVDKFQGGLILNLIILVAVIALLLYLARRLHLV